MTVKLPVKKEDEIDPKDPATELPPEDIAGDNPPQDTSPSAEDRLKEKELEVAELKGRISGIKEKEPTPQPPTNTEDQQWMTNKAQIMGDTASQTPYALNFLRI